MNRRRSLAWATALRIATLASNLLPRERADWSHAMRNEIHYLPTGRAALWWAISCMVASCFERVHSMETGTVTISRQVLALEMLLCFGLHTLVFSSLFWSPVSSVVTGSEWFFLFSWTIVGPIGLVVAFRFIILNVRPMNRVLLTALCISAAGTLVAYSLFLLTKGSAILGWWRELFLFGGLPVLGAAHLAIIATDRSTGWPKAVSRRQSQAAALCP